MKTRNPPRVEGRRRASAWLSLQRPHPLSRSTLPGLAGWHGRRPTSKCECNVSPVGHLAPVNFIACRGEGLLIAWRSSLRVHPVDWQGGPGSRTRRKRYRTPPVRRQLRRQAGLRPLFGQLAAVHGVGWRLVMRIRRCGQLRRDQGTAFVTAERKNRMRFLGRLDPAKWPK